MVFPVIMYGCESWTIKKAERRRIDAFELWCWRRLESPLNCKEIQPVHPKGNQSGYSLEGLMLKWNSNTLATCCEELTHLKRPWCWERLKVGEEGEDRGWDGWMASPTQWTWVWVNSGSWWWTGKPGVLQSMGSQRVRHDWATELNWSSSSSSSNRSSSNSSSSNSSSNKIVFLPLSFALCLGVWVEPRKGDVFSTILVLCSVVTVG